MNFLAVFRPVCLVVRHGWSNAAPNQDPPEFSCWRCGLRLPVGDTPEGWR